MFMAFTDDIQGDETYLPATSYHLICTVDFMSQPGKRKQSNLFVKK